jgi:His-Xaa-Ser system radical SAM maturase HxsC
MGEQPVITLRAKGAAFNGAARARGPAIVRITTDDQRPKPLREREAFLGRESENLPEEFGWYLLPPGTPSHRLEQSKSPAAHLSSAFDYLADGDVIALEPESGAVRTLFRKNVRYNSFLLTERCNNYCLMCSQPPRNVEDGWIVDEILQAIPLIDRGAGEIGFTGGEPTLLGDRFLELVRSTESFLPGTALHVLSNGRSFADESLARNLGRIRHHDLMIGIPLYTDLAHIHDYVVQADGAFDETIRGILNLKAHGVRVEIRIVLQKQTYERLPQFARFVARNLRFVDHVTFMGLETTGFARANLDRVWIDPADYQQELAEAVTMLQLAHMHVSIYNSQLCVLDPRLHRFARRSISDWKQEYMPECEGCKLLDDCGGFFSSAKYRYSRAIKAVLEEAA